MEKKFTNEPEAHFSESLIKNIEQGNKTEVLSILLTTSPSHLTDISGSTLLHVAARYNSVWLVQYLIDSGENVNAPNHSKETPLMVAIMHNQIETVEMLLDANADIFFPDISGQCALRKAFDNIGLTGEKNGWDRNMLKITCKIVTALQNRVTSESLSNSKHVDNQIFHVDCPLYMFISMKNAEITRILLEKGSPVNAQESNTKKTPLHIAVEELDFDNVKLLLEYGADVNATSYSGNTPLAFFVDFRDRDKVLAIFNALIAAGAILIDRDRGIIFVRSLLTNGDKEIVRNVLNCKIDLHFMDKGGITVLHHLAYNKNPNVLAVLGGFDFDVKIRTKEWKRTMLHCAGTSGNASSIEFLLNRGADINAKCCNDYTPLNLILIYHHQYDRLDVYVKCIEILLAQGADPQIVTEKNSQRQSHVFYNEPLSNSLIELMDPILSHLSLIEASDRKIIQSMQNIILSIPKFKHSFNLKTKELKGMKEISLGKSVTLLDFLVATDEKISMYARYRSFNASSFDELKKDNLESCYQRKLEERFSKWTQLVELRMKAATVIDNVFVELGNVSVYDVAEKIIRYLEDDELHTFLEMIA